VTSGRRRPAGLAYAAKVPDRRDVAAWLPGSGPRPPNEPAPGEGPYPGRNLGRPLEGPGSIAGVGRRFLSITIDWILCYLIANALIGSSVGRPPGAFWVNMIFGVVNLVLVGTAGATLGQRVLGIRVEALDGAHPGPVRAAIRAVLLALGFPALTLLWQRDQRGLHELAAGTVTARS
jgi:uncharacterized RDD family membrane protein YckC